MQQRVAVIGSGVGGLAVAIRLAVAGHHVTVFEAQDRPGGKLTEIQVGDYRFDAGPSLCTMPHWIQELFILAGRNPDDYIRFIPLSVVCHYFFADGLRVNAYADVHQFAKEIHEKLNVPPQLITNYLQNSAKLYEGAGKLFLEESLHTTDLLRMGDTYKALFGTSLKYLFGTLHDVNHKSLKHPKLVQLFDRYATYNGSNPYQTPGMMSMIPHLEHGIGAVFPVGGMIAITQSLYRLATELGVEFRFNTAVERIEVHHHQAKMLHYQGGKEAFDRFVSNMDVVPTYRKLLPDLPAPEKTLAQERSSSAFIFYWGIGRSFPALGLHNIFFGSDYEKEFGEIFTRKVPPTDPTIYLNISSKYAPADAPEGKENWFILVNVPARTDPETDAWGEILKARVLDSLSRRLDCELKDHLEAEAVLTPRLIESRTSSYLGALYGTASNNRYAAFLRHPNFHRKISNLYFCGGSVHPGGGIPLCLASAKIVAKLVSTSPS